MPAGRTSRDILQPTAFQDIAYRWFSKWTPDCRILDSLTRLPLIWRSMNHQIWDFVYWTYCFSFFRQL
jgi:hypothetical protein